MGHYISIDSSPAFCDVTPMGERFLFAFALFSGDKELLKVYYNTQNAAMVDSATAYDQEGEFAEGLFVAAFDGAWLNSFSGEFDAQKVHSHNELADAVLKELESKGDKFIILLNQHEGHNSWSDSRIVIRRVSGYVFSEDSGLIFGKNVTKEMLLKAIEEEFGVENG